MSLLLPSRPLIVLSDLAERIGLNEAIVLQQIQYWLTETNSGIEHEGRRWVYNSIREWHKQFKFWNEKTVSRTFTSLEKQGLITGEKLSKDKRDQTKYYAINYDHAALDDAEIINNSIGTKCPTPLGQNVQMQKDKVTSCNGTKSGDSIGTNCPNVLTEITTKSTQEITSDKNTLGSSAAPTDPEVEITDKAIQVLKHLSQVTASRYQNCKSSLENIRGRLRDGFTTDELILVVDFSVERWGSNLDMAPNLNPTTLFHPGKFPTYLSSATNWSKASRPPRAQWSTANQAKPKGYVDMDFSKQDYSSIPTGFRNGYSSEQPREQAAPVDRSDLPKWLLERTGGAV